MFISIVNWDKYNPRNDVKHPTWFRLENSFWTDPLLTPLDSDGKVVWMVLLAHASRAQSGTFEVDQATICVTLRMQQSAFDASIKHFQAAGKIKKHTSRPRTARVTPTSRPRTVDNRQTDRQTDTTNTTGRVGRLRSIGWEPGHALAKCFENLLAIPAYAEVFDAPREEITLDGHRVRHKLTVGDLETITWNFRCWADGPTGQKLKSPRGTLATFVANFLKTPREEPKQSAKSKLDEMYPLITRKEDCY